MRHALIGLVLAVPFIASAATSLGDVFAELETQYGVPAGTLARIARAESGFNPSARNPGSSAVGLFQWLDTSWLHASRALYGQARPLDERTNPTVSAKVTAFTLAQAYTQLKGHIERLGIDATTGLYMSHFLGTSGAKKFFEGMIQDPNAGAAAFFPKAAASNRSIFFVSGRPRSFNEIVQLMARKLGTSTAVPVAGDFTDPRGVPLSRSSADIRPTDFVPLAQIPQTETERDYQTTYAPSGMTPFGAGSPGGGAGSPVSGNSLLGGNLPPPMPAVPLMQTPGFIQSSMLFASSVPDIIAPSSPAQAIISRIQVDSGTRAALRLRDDLRQATMPIPTPQREDSPTSLATQPAPMQTDSFGRDTRYEATSSETLQFIARAADTLRDMIARLMFTN